MTTPYYSDDVVTLHHGDCLDVLRTLPDASVDAVVTDPPYGLEFMGKAWDSFGRGEAASNATAGPTATGYTDGAKRIERPSFLGGLNPKCTNCGKWQRGGNPCRCDAPAFTDERGPRLRAFQEWCEAWSRECYRVLKPGGHMLAFGGSRTWHRLAAGIEDAGFEIRDSVAWVYAQGFPKSLNVAADARFCQCERGDDERAEGVEGMERRGADSRLRAVRHGGEALPEPGEATDPSLLLVQLPLDGAQLDLGGEPVRPNREAGEAPVRGGQPGMEGRGDASPREGELRAGAAGSLPAGVRGNGDEERVRVAAPARDGAMDRAAADSDGVRESHRSRHVEQRAVEPRAVPDEPGSQARGGWTVCAGCGKPQVAGLGTALKPAFEPVVVARKPLVGTVAGNVLAYGTGALNIDGCRIETDEDRRRNARGGENGLNGEGTFKIRERRAEDMPETSGRWPANVVLDESQAAELDRQSGTSTSRIGKPRGAASGDGWGMTATGAEYDDAGGASRFFPTFEMSAEDWAWEARVQTLPTFRYEAKAPTSERPKAGEVQHPTVKPLDLMRWLVRLVTPPGGVVLEPFAGSGTTVEAAVLEGFSCIAIEREAEYLPLIEQRLSKPLQQSLFDESEVA